MDKSTTATLIQAGIPTKEDADMRDRASREARASERKADEKRAAYLRDHPPKRGLSELERREYAIIGLERAAKAERRQNNTTKADKLDALIAKARTHLERHTVAKAEYEEQPQPDEILTAGAEPIAKRLQKAVGGFDTDAEALAYVLKSWPLTKLRTDAVRVSDKRGKLSRLANTEQRSFWETVERAGGLATGKPGSNEVITMIINMGLM